MTALPKVDSMTVSAIYGAYESRAENPRAYLGCSQIGEECDRALWYSFRWVNQSSFSGRMLRLFNRGHIEEPRIIADLENIGVTILSTQDGVVDETGHIKGHTDGTATGIPEAPKKKHVLEFKTHSAKSYANLVKLGVQFAQPKHYVQVQLYMHLTSIDRCLYIAVNKDTEELYSERIKYDPVFAIKSLVRAQEIVHANEPPVKQYNAEFYKCRMCDKAEICHDSEQPQRNCRTCYFSSPGQGGTWRCGKHDGEIPIEAQAQHHDCHRFIPALVPFEQVDVQGETVIYDGFNDDGQSTWAKP